MFRYSFHWRGDVTDNTNNQQALRKWMILSRRVSFSFFRAARAM
jgi:hypothetical protein